METLESLKRKMEGATELDAVVRTMKAMAASSIGQYEMANHALVDYYRTVELGLKAWFSREGNPVNKETEGFKKREEPLICAVVFGSGQGLVGQFNDLLADYVMEFLKQIPGKKLIWAVGERIQLRLLNDGHQIDNFFSVPSSVKAITSLVGNILVPLEAKREKHNSMEFYLFHNRPVTPSGGKAAGFGYLPASQQLFPFDEKWRNHFSEINWPTKRLPQVVGAENITLLALIREYFFVSIYKACAESLASENSSRLEAMQRAEKNIGELLDEFSHKYHHLRQLSIDEELFDVVSGFEAMKITMEKSKN